MEKKKQQIEEEWIVYRKSNNSIITRTFSKEDAEKYLKGHEHMVYIAKRIA